MMKNTNTILAFLLALVTLAACHKDKEMDVKEAVVSNEEMTVTETQARFSWQVDFAGQFQTGVELSQNDNMNDLRRVEATKVEDRFQAVVEGLLEGTKYYYRIVVWNKFSSSEQPVGHFTTMETLPDTTYYIIAVACMPEEGGRANGGGTIAEGDTCTVIATANAGYNFLNWTENESQVSTDSIYTFAVTRDRVLVANFYAHPQPQDYTIRVSANPSNGGTVTGDGTFSQGESCTVIATAAEGYTFTNWTENGNVVSEEVHYTFAVNDNRILVANFNLEQYTITTSADPVNSGIVTGGGSYNYGASCTLTATANNNALYEFDHWTKNGSSYSGGSSITFTVMESATYMACFHLKQYMITAMSNPTDGGTINGNQSQYTYGQTCNLIAMPANGYSFTNWTENDNVVSTENPYTFTVTGNRNLVANFAEQTTYPAGTINGKFTINPNHDQVYFSQGNLQYIGSTQTWKFADHQWEVIGTSQGNSSQTTIRDLFGWGTSGWSGSGATYYHPWDTDKSNGSLYGPPGQYNLTGTYANADWGVYNPINSGGQVGQWRTLTKDEWHCVFNTRNASTVNGTANARYVKAKVSNVKGMILFPDNYTHPSGVEQPVGINQPGNTGWNENNYSATDFELMEDNGAVFLPAAGTRDGTTVGYVGGYGFYWSTSCHMNNNDLALFVLFTDDEIMQDYYYRYVGQSVRLVCPAGN